MRRWWVAMVFVAAACGQVQPQTVSQRSATPSASPGATPTVAASASTTTAASPIPSPPPTPPQQQLFAALEVKGGANNWNTLAIAGLDGYARAKTSFVPIPPPYVGCAGAAPPRSAHVAAGKVYFVDGTGTVRSLSPHGQLAVVTTFPFTGSQQMISFAVSPDGSKLLGAVFSLPPKPNVSDPCTGAAPFPSGSFTIDVYAAAAGGPSRLLYHQLLATSGSQPIPNVMAFVGWDKIGPVATFPTEYATQGGGPRPPGVMVRVDPSTGKVLRQVDDPVSCMVWDIASSGDYVCTPPQTGDISVRRPDGTQIWGYKATSGNPYADPFLSPAEDRVAVGGNDTAVVSQSASHVALGGTYPLGWLDDSTVIGGGYGTNFTYLRVDAPTNAVDIGFTGMFIGSLGP